jgi:hypothetical protein
MLLLSEVNTDDDQELYTKSYLDSLVPQRLTYCSTASHEKHTSPHLTDLVLQ